MMKRILLFSTALLSAWIAFAEGPLYSHKDKFVNQEFQNTYQDIRTKIPIYSSSTFLSTGSASSFLTVSSANAISVSTSGQVTQPFQSCFLVNAPVNTQDVTGDNTAHRVEFDTVIYDLHNDFTPTAGNYKFTAPVNGKYLLIAQVMGVLTHASHTSLEVNIATTKRYYRHYITHDPTVNAYVATTNTVIADMDAGDIAFVEFAVNGTSKTAEVYDDTLSNYFSGTLIN